ncbi:MULTISPECIES: hypothetical protein [unclassified Clostridium]|uniref:hypothetical protein n=1 Tax=unclassified Clostridium TaxID=2614128 RepID=UPI000297A4B5|nr:MULTISPECIES: hypothetical protein [unclassified Clostridium]EKQ56403.1 MAG: hypothetical protein A370_01995 [Clostridium sp. Maddingley MBC34-26]
MINLFRYEFLGLNGGFWFIALPLASVWISSNLYLKDRDKNCLNALGDFGVIEDIEESELFRMEFKVSKEEKWKIGQVLKRSKYNNVDELVRNSLYEVIE